MDYYEISSWRTIKNDANKRKLSNSESLHIMNLTDMKLSHIDKSEFIYRKKTKIGDIKYFIKIKATSDDWYYVKIYFQLQRIITVFKIFQSSSYELSDKVTYKCDQLSGVVDCIKNEIINSSKNEVTISRGLRK